MAGRDRARAYVSRDDGWRELLERMSVDVLEAREFEEGVLESLDYVVADSPEPGDLEVIRAELDRVGFRNSVRAGSGTARASMCGIVNPPSE
jgi:hypothetical protein